MADGKLVFETKLDESGFKSGLEKLKSGATGLASGITKAVTVAGTAFKALQGVAVKVGSEFEGSMSQVAATMGMTVDEINNGSEAYKKLESAAREMGATTQFSASEASEALNYIALAGYDADDAVKLLPKTLNLAAAGGLELGYATDIVTDAMSALGLSIEDADSFIDQMAKTSQKSNTSVGQLGEAILAVGGTAKDLAGGTVELNTALGILANNGIKGSEGGTKLRNVITSLTAPTKNASIAMEDLGIYAYDADGNMRPLQDTLADISFAMELMTTEERKQWLNTVFNRADLAAVSALLAANASGIDDIVIALDAAGLPGEEFRSIIGELQVDFESFADKQEFVNYAMKEFGITAEQAGVFYDALKSSIEGNEWNNLEKEIRNAQGAAEEMAKTLLNNFKGDITILKSALQELAVSFYQTFDEKLRGAVQSATGVIDELSLAMKGIDASKLSQAFEEAGLSVEELDINLVQAMFKMDQFSDKSEFIEWAMQAWGVSAEEAEKAFNILTESLENTGDSVQLIGDIIGQTVGDIAVSIAEGLPKFVEVGVQIINSILDGIGRNAQKVGQSAAKIVNALIKGILDITVKLFDVGLKLLTELIKGITENLGEIKTAGSEALENFLDTLKEGLPQLLLAGLELIKALVEGIWEAVPQLIEAAPQIINEFIEMINGNIEEILQLGVEIILAIAEGLIESIPLLAESIPQIVMAIVTCIVENLGLIVEAGVEIVLALVEALIDNAPKMLEAAASLVTNLISGLKEANLMEVAIEIITTLVGGILSLGDMLLEVGVQIISFISEGLLSAVEKVLGVVGDIVMAIVEKFVGFVTEFVKIGIDLIQGIIDGFTEKKDKVLEKANEIMENTKEKIDNFKEKFKKVASNLFENIRQGFHDKKDAVVNKANEIIESVRKKIDDFKNKFKEVATSLFENVKQGFHDKKDAVLNKANEIMESAKEKIDGFKSQFFTVGSNIISGLAEGIIEGASVVIDAAKAVVTNAVNAAKGFLGINSPSRLFKEEVGKQVSLGLAEGIEDGKDSVIKSTLDVSKNLVAKAKDTISDINSSFSLQGSLKAPALAYQGAGGEASSPNFNINLYGVDYGKEYEAMDYGKKLGKEVDREYRRKGL